MNRKKVAALKAAALAALVLFVGWPLFRAMTSTPGVVRLSGAAPNLIAYLNGYIGSGGPRFEESNYILSDVAVFYSDSPSMLGVGGSNNQFMGHVTYYPPKEMMRQSPEHRRRVAVLSLAHELCHLTGYVHDNNVGEIMHPPSVYAGTARLAADQTQDLNKLSGSTVILRVGETVKYAIWILNQKSAVPSVQAAELAPTEDRASAQTYRQDDPQFKAIYSVVTILCYLGYAAVGMFILYVIYDGFLKGER